ncbi:hypothetical protein LIER_06783 [Lithospermum erythrorhizon]|uniref:Uncharacterized protein n=1 Tax=Lithospermum erythrorhizon TaxID=34254 RepID=A0AAV3P703_LITER
MTIASYSASLFVVLNENLKAYSKFNPSGPWINIPAPDPLGLLAPSTCKVHGVILEAQVVRYILQIFLRVPSRTFYNELPIWSTFLFVPDWRVFSS